MAYFGKESHTKPNAQSSTRAWTHTWNVPLFFALNTQPQPMNYVDCVIGDFCWQLPKTEQSLFMVMEEAEIVGFDGN